MHIEMNIQIRLKIIYPLNNTLSMVSHKDPFLDQYYVWCVKNLEFSIKYVKTTFFVGGTSIFINESNINAVQDNVDTTVKQLLRWFEKIDY